MANQRRASNRMRHRGDIGGKHLENREETHVEKNHRGGSTATRSSGSHAHVGESRGGGVVPGAGELPALGPGKAGTSVRPDMAGLPEPAASGKPPKGLKTVTDSDA